VTSARFGWPPFDEERPSLEACSREEDEGGDDEPVQTAENMEEKPEAGDGD
jgi:hypothetical protein